MTSIALALRSQTRWRRAMIIIFASQIIIVGLFVWRLRRSIQHSIEARCGRALRGTCTVPSFATRADGVIARNIDVLSLKGGIHSNIAAVKILWDWALLLAEIRQDVTLEIEGMHLKTDASLEDLKQEFEQMTRRAPSMNAYRLVRMQTIRVRDFESDVAIVDGVNSYVHGFNAEWSRGSIFTAQWKELGVHAGSIQLFSVKACGFKLDFKTETATVDCEGLHRSMHVPKLNAVSDVMRMGMTLLAPDSLRNNDLFRLF